MTIKLISTNDKDITPIWKDECRASINAAKTAHNLTDRDKSNLVMDAIYRAKEFGHLIEMDDFMKEVVYGYSNGEKNISYNITPINYVSEASEVGKTEKRICNSRIMCSFSFDFCGSFRSIVIL